MLQTKIYSISILIPTHNRESLLEKTLNSLSQINVPLNLDVEVIVTANACKDRTLYLLAEYQKTFPFQLKFFNELEPGANIARNRCLQEAQGEILAIVDDDVQFDKDWLVGLVEAFESDSIDIVGGRVLLWWEAVNPPQWLTPQLQILLSAYDLGDSDLAVSLPGPIGANLAFRRSVYESLGSMSTSIQNKHNKINRGDEIEYLTRADKAGFKALYASKALVYHWVPPNKLRPEFFKTSGLGFGSSRVYMKERYTLFVILKSLIGFSYLAARYACQAIWSKYYENESDYLYNLYRCMVGIGGIKSLFSVILNN
jgi:glucosyl-dolichyl phosphate glucuronosyltransferase